jgi:drug/metabolite transporter (DMT)-like permease
VIFIKASTEHPLLIAAYRLFVAALVLTPLFVRQLRQTRVRDPRAYSWKQLGWSVLPAAALAIHFMSWVIGARMTLASNASLLVNMLPVALPFFLWVFYKERVTRIELLGTLFALVGVLLLSGSNFRVSFQTFLGDMICLGSMLAFAVYMAYGRRNGGRIGLWLYLVPLYYMAGLMCLGVALFYVNPIKAYSLENILYIAGLGLIPTIFGHSILNYSMKYFRGQVVGIANLGQIIFAGILGMIFFQEIPGLLYYIAALWILAGILVVILGNGRNR